MTLSLGSQPNGSVEYCHLLYQTAIIVIAKCRQQELMLIVMIIDKFYGVWYQCKSENQVISMIPLMLETMMNTHHQTKYTYYDIYLY